MSDHQTTNPSFPVRDDQPLIGVIVQEDGKELTRYFTDDLSWEETAAALDRIRHESQPTPPIEL